MSTDANPGLSSPQGGAKPKDGPSNQRSHRSGSRGPGNNLSGRGGGSGFHRGNPGHGNMGGRGGPRGGGRGGGFGSRDGSQQRDGGGRGMSEFYLYILILKDYDDHIMISPVQNGKTKSSIK